MKIEIVIRNPKTNLYVTTEGVWTADATKARDFRHTHVALEYCRQDGCAQYEIVMKSKDDIYDVAVFDSRGKVSPRTK